MHLDEKNCLQLKESELLEGAMGKYPVIFEHSQQKQTCRDREYHKVSSVCRCGTITIDNYISNSF